MSNQTKEAIETVLRNIRMLGRVVRQLKALPSLPEYVEVWVAPTSEVIRLDLPFEWGKFREVRAVIGKDWHMHYTHTADDGSWYRCYRNSNENEILLRMNPEMLGKNCQRIQVGTKVVPIYEVVCN